MNARQITLHGGPMHGRVMYIPDDMDHIHIAGVRPEAMQRFTEGPNDVPDEEIIREGIYSQVSGPNNRNNFEWDGFIQHD